MKEQLNEAEKMYAETDCAETTALYERQRVLGIVKDIVSMCSSISSEEWAWVNNKLDELLAKGGADYDNKI